jgi:hypothetical protein
MTELAKRRFIKASNAAITGIAFNFASPAIAQSISEIRRRLPASWPRSLDVPFGACETFAKYIAEATENKFLIQLCAAGEIASTRQVLEICHRQRAGWVGGDRPKQPIPIAQRHAQFFQIAVGQLGKHIAWPPLAHVGDEPTNISLWLPTTLATSPATQE